MVNIDQEKKRAKLACDASQLIQAFNEMNHFEKDKKYEFSLLPEYGNWMIEAVPA